MERLRQPVLTLAPEELQRLALRGSGESDVGQSLRGTCPRLHLRCKQSLGIHFAAILKLGPFLRGQELLQLGCRLARLRAVGLVGNHCEALALRCGQLLHGLQGEREGLDGANDDFLAAFECQAKLGALAARLPCDGRYHTRGALEVEDGFL
ncbi:hypothetical protein D3C87_1710190 [compost metagenome]